MAERRALPRAATLADERAEWAAALDGSRQAHRRQGRPPIQGRPKRQGSPIGIMPVWTREAASIGHRCGWSSGRRPLLARRRSCRTVRRGSRWLTYGRCTDLAGGRTTCRKARAQRRPNTAEQLSLRGSARGGGRAGASARAAYAIASLELLDAMERPLRSRPSGPRRRARGLKRWPRATAHGNGAVR